MRLTRIFIDQEFAEGKSLPLPGSAFHHLIKVLRLKEGDAFIAFNGNKKLEARATIDRIEKKTASATIQSFQEANRESLLDLTLVQAISAADKMDFTIQKSVELGVTRIVPVYSARSQRRMKPIQIEKKMKHWRGIIVHATEQSGRTVPAGIAHPTSLIDYLEQRNPRIQGIVLDPTAGKSIHELQDMAGKIEILVGPEGGFTPDELAAMTDQGIEGLHLGPRILRTETAGMALLACLQARFGDF